MLRLAAGGLSNGKFSIAVMKILNYRHGVQQRYHMLSLEIIDILIVFSLIYKNNSLFAEQK